MANKTFNAIVSATLIGDDKSMSRALKNVVKEMKKVDSAAQKAASKSSKMWDGLNKAANIAAVGFTALSGAIIMSVKDYANFGVTVAKLSAQSGMGAEATSRFVGQLQFLHVETKSAGVAMKTLQKGIYGLQTGSKASVDAFKILGLSWKDLANLNTDERIQLIRDRMSELKDPAARAAAATALLGRGAKDMGLWYTASADSMKRLNGELEKNGQILSEKQLKDAEAAAVAWKDFTGALKGLEYAVAQSALAPLSKLAEIATALVREVRPLAPLIVPLTAALGAFVIVVKTAAFFQKTWGQALGLMPGQSARNIAAEEEETGAITAQTTAIEANTTARWTNDSVPMVNPGGLGTGTGIPGPVGTGGGGLGGGPVATTASPKFTWGSFGMNTGMIAGGVGATKAVVDLKADEMRQLEDGIPKWKAMRVKYQDIVDQIAAVKPTDPGAKDKLKWLSGQLKDMDKALKGTTLGGKTQLDKDIGAAIAAVDKATPSFTKAAEAAAKLSDELRTAFKSTDDFATAMATAVQMGTALPTAAQAAYAAQSSAVLTPAQLAKMARQADRTNTTHSSIFGSGQTGVKYHKFARGGAGRTTGPMLALIGESGPEDFNIRPAKGRNSSGGGIHIHIGTVIGTDRAAAEKLAGMVGKVLSRQARFAHA